MTHIPCVCTSNVLVQSGWSVLVLKFYLTHDPNYVSSEVVTDEVQKPVQQMNLKRNIRVLDCDYASYICYLILLLGLGLGLILYYCAELAAGPISTAKRPLRMFSCQCHTSHATV